MSVAVVGGGIAGLAAAWELRGKADVTVFEPGRLGGSIRTTPFGGRPVDEAADAFVTRSPDAVRLCKELGIESELIAPSAGRSMLWWNGRLRHLPDGLVLGVPGRLPALLSSRILSFPGIARAALDLVKPRRKKGDSLSVRELVADRFGFQVADRLVDPLVGSIYAGWTGRLGATEVAPQLVQAAERSRSLALALRKLETPNTVPLFLSPKAGMGRLADVLVASLREFGTAFVPERVDALEPVVGAVRLAPTGQRFDAVIVATPARSARSILDNGSRSYTSLLEVPTASVAIVTASFTGLELPSGVNGFLVPRGNGKLMTACSFGSNKWPHWADPGVSVVRMSTGRFGETSSLDLDDADLSSRLTDELAQALDVKLRPLEIRVSRWPDTFPQYLPGHLERIAAVETALQADLPRVTLAGASYRGLGVAACIASGRKAAREALARMTPAGK